jgi:hypothetical protein
VGVLSYARKLASDMSARTEYIIPATPDLIGGTGFYPIRGAAPGGARAHGCGAGAAKYQLPNRAFFLPTRDLSFTAEAVRSLATLIKAGGADRCRPRCSGTWATPSASVT